MILQTQKQRVIGKGCLYQYLTRFLSTPRTSCHLHQLREEFLARSKIRTVQSAVGIQHPDQSQCGEIMAFRQHLRADQNIYLVRLYLLTHDFPGALVARTVAIHTQDARIGKAFPQCAFYPLRPAPDWLQIGMATAGTSARQPHLIAAKMTAQALILEVQHHFPGAVLAI